jgi:hypothetical protein
VNVSITNHHSQITQSSLTMVAPLSTVAADAAGPIVRTTAMVRNSQDEQAILLN